MDKKLIVIFIALILIVTIVVLSSTVFLVKTIDVEYTYCDKYTRGDLLEASSSCIDSSIFTVSKNKLISQIEKKVPYAEITSIEKVFPNKMVIYSELRVAAVAIPVDGSASSYCILDRDLKLLDVKEYATINQSTTCMIVGLTINSANPTELIGDFLPADEDSKLAILKNIFVFAQAENPGLVGTGFSSFFKSIDFSTDGVIKITTSHTQSEYWIVNVSNYEKEIRAGVAVTME